MFHSRMTTTRFVLLQFLIATVLTRTGFVDENDTSATRRESLVSVGVARIDVTPEGPIRLNGYAVRKTESTGIAQKLWAKALAIGADGQGPAVLITVDNCVVPGELTDEVARRLHEKAGIRRDRFVVCASHTHAGPCLAGAAPFIFAEPTPPEHQARISRYTERFTDQLEKVALDALAARQPGRLAWAQGRVGFAANRRRLENNKWVGFGVNHDGPVDHDLPVLGVTDPEGELRAVLVNYACHATTVKSYDVHGDWPGSAQRDIETNHPGVTAMVSIGCGADANPQPFDEAEVDRHGKAIADEVERLLAGPLRPVRGLPECRLRQVRLPLDELPTRAQWEKQATGNDRPAYYARIVLERLDRGIQPPTSFPYTIRTWTFGDDLGMVFLSGEVVVDYSLRLKKELGDDLWVTAYANDVPCYIASRRVIEEGGYEVDGSMPTFDKPTRLALGAEDLIVETVEALLPRRAKRATDAASEPSGERPNILWITCEDMSPNLGCYGDAYAVTPNLDRLAARGVRYTHVFSHAGVCAPSRSGLITGMYPTSLGSHHMRCTTSLPDFVKCFPEYLRETGYFCTNQSKTDYNFPVPPNAWDVPGGAKAHWRNRKPGQPFFSVFNLTITHESRIRANYEKLEHDPAQAVLPPYLPDTPLVRRDWARYHDLITQMDAQAGRLLDQLEEDGLADETIVFFFSDHGVGLPRAKQWIYDAGTHVPLVIYFPEKYRHLAPASPGSAIDRLVGFVDLGPSVLSLLGLEIPGHVQGVPFLGSQAGEPRQYVYGVRDRMDERYDMNRTVRDHHYKYHRNYFPSRPFAPWLDYMEKLATMQEWRRLRAEGKLSGVQAFFMQDTKPVEELYDIQADRFEQVNLADSPQHEDVLKRMREAHFEWVRRTLDLGLLPEQDMRNRARGSTEYEMARSGSEAFPVDRIFQTAVFFGQGPDTIPELLQRCDDDDAAVRFWAVIGLTNTAARDESVVRALETALADSSVEVRIVAAEALCRIDREETALPVLTDTLTHESSWIRLQAANVLDRVGEKARPAVDAIGKAAEDPGQENMFVRWVLAHTLKQLSK
ncbi:MAG TPA: neutral/alkaline non-lysosomal ceramidase N-terminal domain-containing protein [Thermoguttaceae bacterium]|nr:neutral/alkaline non-lysosomal ceramidase N-terminal domain-containing protein [Thermoguttaceae bacterium]